MNIYQHLIKMNKAPDECVGKDFVTIFKTEDGELGLGLCDKLLTPKNKTKVFKPIYRTRLEVEMLSVTPKYLLKIVKELHRRAEEKGLKIKGAEIEGYSEEGC